MKEFLLVFRRDDRTEELQPTTEQMHRHLQHWRNWYSSLAAEGRLARSIGRWDNNGIAHQAPVLELGGTVEVRMSV